MLHEYNAQTQKQLPSYLFHNMFTYIEQNMYDGFTSYVTGDKSRATIYIDSKVELL